MSITYILLLLQNRSSSVKAMEPIGNCQRPVLYLVYLNILCRKYELNRSSELQDNNERKNTLVTQSCVLPDAWFRDLNFLIWGLKIKLLENYFFLKNYATAEGAVSHNVLGYQPLPITRYQVSFYASSYTVCWAVTNSVHCL